MKIIVKLAVEIDPENWDQDHGTGTSAAAVRADVRSYVENLVHEYLRGTVDGRADLVA